MTKPMGVRIIATGSFLEAAVIAIMGIRPMLPVIYQLLNTSNYETSNGLAEIAAMAVLDSFVFAVLHVLAGWGLWKLKNWARVLAIILSTLAAVFELLRWLFAHHLGVSYILSIGISAVIIFYLTRPSVAAVFSQDSVGIRRSDQLT
ncbi:MAG: DUF2127 domain-containing protein [Terriglobales bacterium]